MKRKPSSAQIDMLCAVYKSLQAVEVTAAENTATAASKLLTAVANYGQPRAEKSLELVGLEYEAIRTQGDSTKIMAVPAAQLVMMMCHAGLKKEARKMFARESRFVILPTYQETLTALQGNRKFTKRMREILTAAVKTEKQNPRLTVNKLKKSGAASSRRGSTAGEVA